MSDWEWALLYIGGPFVLGLVATVLTGIRWPRNARWMALTGVALAVGYVVLAYFSSPPSGAPYDGCSDCENSFGRWWEPQLVILFTVIGYFLWLLGVGAAVAARASLTSARRAFQKHATRG